jgi:uncharacterized protein YkwD
MKGCCVKRFFFIINVLGLLLALVVPAAAKDASLAKQVLAEINLARTNPRVYAGFLREFRSRFLGNSYTLPGSRVRVLTSEGVAAVDEAIRFLSRQRALPALTWSAGLGAAAAELAGEQGETGATGHGDAGNNGMRERIERQGKWERSIAENIAYGPDNPRSMVMQLIVDDGVPGRGHRKNQFNPAFGTAGVACGPHPRFGNICVIDFAGGFRE